MTKLDDLRALTEATAPTNLNRATPLAEWRDQTDQIVRKLLSEEGVEIMADAFHEHFIDWLRSENDHRSPGQVELDGLRAAINALIEASDV